jgi:hypothetical protein
VVPRDKPPELRPINPGTPMVPVERLAVVEPED